MHTQIFNDEILPHLDRLYSFARNLTLDVSKAEDLTQATVEKALKSMDKYQVGSNGKAWIFTICRNLFLNQIRSDKSKGVTVDITDPGLPIQIGTITPEVGGEGKIMDGIGDEMFIALRRLNVDQRELILYSSEGFSYEEMAEMTDTVLNTVRTRLKRARDLMIELLTDYAAQNGIRKKD
jgi:RNA polymerase sigma-70 factor, ECF subfamily